ncbi:hypothetical protein ACP4OV_026254 [Aristida adscensionis]
MAWFQEINVGNGNDHRAAGDHTDHDSFMNHLGTSPDNCGNMDLPAEEQLPKARKPYTISKQREKWTEDEHKLFLESLQLHGRAWRRIQEHIGSKTAVQIRSHAQKFFSKVVRESIGDGNGTAAAPQIRIPPPRPKRKPAHPYPRKLGNSPGKEAPALKQLERPQLQIQSLFEHENCSPKSVLSPAQLGSETVASDSSVSPASSVDVEERCPAPRIPPVEVAAQASPSEDDNSSTVLKDVTCGMPDGPVLRLFGKRVVVNDLHQQPNSNTGNIEPATDMELDASSETETSVTEGFSSQVAAEANTWSPWLIGRQQFMFYLPQGEFLAVHSANPFFSYDNGSRPGRVLNPQVVASNRQQHQQQSQAAHCQSMREEGSWTESNITSNSVPETTQNSDSVESLQASPAPVCVRGFMPYKKCGASMVPKLLVPGGEEDGEMTRLCL